MVAREFGLGHFEGDSLAFSVLAEADADDVAGEVDEGTNDVVFAERHAEVLELAVST